MNPEDHQPPEPEPIPFRPAWVPERKFCNRCGSAFPDDHRCMRGEL